MKRLLPIILALAAGVATADGAAYTDPSKALSAGGGFGSLETRAQRGLSGHDPGNSLHFNFAYRFRPRFAFAFDIETHRQEYATPDFVRAPFLGTVDDTMNISTAAATVQGLYSVPLWRTRLHLGAGAGLYRSRLTIDGTMLGVPGTVADETDSDFGTHVLARWDVRVRRSWWLGAEYRRIDASADFGRWTNGTIDVGGTARYITLRRQFDATRWPPLWGNKP
jgi:opacity protein-like surface antigen